MCIFEVSSKKAIISVIFGKIWNSVSSKSVLKVFLYMNQEDDYLLKHETSIFNIIKSGETLERGRTLRLNGTRCG